MHGLAVFALLSAKPDVQARGQDRPLMVSLVELAPPAPKPAEPARPRPAVAPMAVPQPPILAAPASTPASMSASMPQAAARSEMEMTEVAPAATAAQAATAAPATVVPPRFDADYLSNPAPAYPALSRRMGEQGKVLLRVYVEPDGSAARVELKTSSGFERLDNAALSAVRKWRFVPARQGDAAVGAWVVVPIVFSLRS
ncbi:energy transducer TonB [Sulfuritortus calidifontis]|uniref:energy transducer TonB n=1 Tax=Sulfuritortus calidifontis TaxID=1914471 RepID=UPI001046DABC|nr:energy transducer TonB [Sulfuritortus calidifontis]